MRSTQLSYIFLFILCSFSLSAQKIEYGYFRSPIEETEPLRLAGNFGEMRPNHFHTGIDIKTCGVEGLPVYACADGFISRIYISAGGYGNALYIDHPNGYTTVYGHLMRFNNEIAKFVRQSQYSSQSFEQDIHPDRNKFQFKKGDLIGFTGNTGSSEGAHLHFEIRETLSEKPVNPLLWGFNVPDTILPVIRAIKIYALGPGSFVEVVYPKGKISKAIQGQNLKIAVGGKSGSYYLKNVLQLRAGGQIGFSIEADDYHEKNGHGIGPYSIELCVDTDRRYFYKMERLDFDMKRFVNAHADYAERMRTGHWFEKSYLKGYNEMPIYEGLKDNGIITPAAGQKHKLQYYVRDVNENQSVLTFMLDGMPGGLNIPPKTDSSAILIPYARPFAYKQNGLMLNLPANTFYEDFSFKDIIASKPPKGYSEIHEFGSRYIAVYDFYDIGIKPVNLPERLYPKAFIMSMSNGYQGGIVQDGWVISRTRSMGKFFVSVDTIPPVIRPLNIKQGANMWRWAELRFAVGDNMAGLKSFRGTIDGQWVLFQYDQKKGVIYYLFDEYCKPGTHKLVLEATDERDNVRRIVMNFSNTTPPGSPEK